MGRPIPNSHRGIVAAADEFGIAGTEAQPVYRLTAMTVQALDGGDARTPVLDVPARVGRQQVVLVVRPGHGAEGGVVRRHYELEAEVDAVPQGEFSLLVPGEESPSAGSPAQAPSIYMECTLLALWCMVVERWAERATIFA